MRTFSIKYWLPVCALFVFTSFVRAQVLIGENKELESFSTLQIEGEAGGLRIPQLSQADLDKLSELVDLEKEDAKGLIVYNTTDDVIAYWDGQVWVNITTKGTLGSKDLKVEGGNGATLDDIELSIKSKAITLNKMKGAELDTDKGKVYATDATDGKPIFIDKSGLSSSIELTNGLKTPSSTSEVGMKIADLGGKLDTSTTIKMENNDLSLTTDGGKFKIDDNTVVVVDNKVGINTENPTVSLHITGAMSTNETTVYTVDDVVIIPSNFGQVMIGGQTSDHFSIQLPTPDLPGKRLIIYNDTNYTGDIIGTLNPNHILPKEAREFFCQDTTWRTHTPKTKVKAIYASQAKIPPYGGAPSPQYNTTDWKFTSGGWSAGRTNYPPRGKLIYEYTGTTVLDLENMYPILTTGNTGGAGDTLETNLTSIQENSSGKIELRVYIARTDAYGESKQNWATNNLRLNIIFVNTMR